jgi:hypothetical protein
MRGDKKPEKQLIQNYNGNNIATVNIPVFRGLM